MDQTPSPVTTPPSGGLSSKAKTLLALTALLVLVLIVLVFLDKQRAQQDANNIRIPASQNQKPVQKTGDVDAVVNGIVADYEGEASVAVDADADADYIGQSTSLTETNNIYNANNY